MQILGRIRKIFFFKKFCRNSECTCIGFFILDFNCISVEYVFINANDKEEIEQGNGVSIDIYSLLVFCNSSQYVFPNSNLVSFFMKHISPDEHTLVL